MKLLDKLFPPIQSGEYRILPPRHELQVSMMIAFIVSSCFQLFGGVAERAAVAAIPSTLLLIMLGASILGAVLCLASAAIVKKRPWEAMGLSLSGFTILTPVLALQVWNYMVNFDDFQSSGPFWITICFAGGFLFRWFHILRDTIRIRRSR